MAKCSFRGKKRLHKTEQEDVEPVWPRRSLRAIAGLAALGATLGKGLGVVAVLGCS